MTNSEFLSELANQINYAKFLCEDAEAKDAITDIILNVDYDRTIVDRHHTMIRHLASTVYRINQVVSKNPELYDSFLTIFSDLPCQKSE